MEPIAPFKEMRELQRRVQEIAYKHSSIEQEMKKNISRITALPKPPSVFESWDFSKLSVFPEIKLPKFDIPQIDYERIEKTISRNSKYGWTLTAYIDFRSYMDSFEIANDQDNIDKYFVSYYEKVEGAFDELVREIKDHVNPKWNQTITRAIKTFKEQSYTELIIPTLLMIIEGELAEIAKNKNLVGRPLISHLQEKVEEEDLELSAYMSYSLFQYLYNSLFSKADFKSERKSLLNRNKVLHGRDNPQNWEVTDIYRLMNVLATVSFVKSELGT